MTDNQTGSAGVTVENGCGVGKRRLYRVQDRIGRGPYIPGFSHRWSSPDGPRMRPWWEEIGVSVGKAILMLPDKMHVGCAFASMDQLHNWFLPEELRKLTALGFHLVEPVADRIICETPTQVVFGTRKPFFGFATKSLPTPPEAV